MKILDNASQREHYDLVVVGSGAAGLTAAATAAHAGLNVLVAEKSKLLGGTSAVSGGMLWVVDNHYARESGIADSKTAGRAYVEAVARGRGRTELLDSAIEHGPDMLRFIADELNVEFLFLDNFPDYRQDLPGAITGGRTIEPQLFNYREALGELADYLRTDGRHPYTMQEYETWGAFTKFPWDEMNQRIPTWQVMPMASPESPSRMEPGYPQEQSCWPPVASNGTTHWLIPSSPPVCTPCVLLPPIPAMG